MEQEEPGHIKRLSKYIVEDVQSQQKQQASLLHIYNHPYHATTTQTHTLSTRSLTLFTYSQHTHRTKHRPEAVAHAADIKTLRKLMEEVHDLEHQLAHTTELPKKIQMKATLKKKMTGKEMVEVLKRLEMKGQPVWGLSVSERALVKDARKLFNSC